jgi:hypothetical protein
METQRFDELTVALVRGGSRRGVLRGLVGGVFGALALDRIGALAKNDEAKAGGKPIANPAKPVCPRNKTTVNCPACSEAWFGPEGDGSPGGGCIYRGTEQECSGAPRKTLPTVASSTTVTAHVSRHPAERTITAVTTR